MVPRIFLGSDHAGINIRCLLAEQVRAQGWALELEFGPDDASTRVDYPNVARRVAHALLRVPGSMGVLVCGTGQGMAMSANRIPGVRAAVCGDCYSAKMTRLHNDANVLCIGARVLGPGLAIEIFDVFSRTEFEGGRHARRVAAIEAVHEENQSTVESESA